NFFAFRPCACRDDGLVELPAIDAVSSLDGTTDPDGAEWLAAGWVKADGCVNFDVGNASAPSYRLHACGLDDARMLARVFRVVYWLAVRHIERFDKVTNRDCLSDPELDGLGTVEPAGQAVPPV